MEQRITYLLQQRLEQKLTPAEEKELLSILQKSKDPSVRRMISEPPVSPGSAFDRRPVFGIAWLGYAAVILVLAGVGGWFFYQNRIQNESRIRQELYLRRDVPPGGE